jgi:deoxycytidylate deaminase
LLPGKTPNPNWDIAEQLSRLVKIITHITVERPTIAETAMYTAYGAQMRSACLSRQVGAALVDRAGNIVATGTNEVPKGGGGLYGEDFAGTKPDDQLDDRCAYRRLGTGVLPYCSNTREQNEIIDELIRLVPQLKSIIEPKALAELKKTLMKSRIGELLEFSRAVHAEMDALLSAARKGVSPMGTRLFVTTFPCHYCARHIVCAGVDEVQFIEPYPKSKARKLHEDSITPVSTGWQAPSGGGSKVLFRPFTGVAPRLYARAFLKDRDLKDKQNGVIIIGEPHSGSPWQVSRVSYPQLEAELFKSALSTSKDPNGKSTKTEP